MKKKIFLYYMVLVIIGMSVTGLFVSKLSQQTYKLEVEERLRNVASLLQYQLSMNPAISTPDDFNRVAKQYAGLLNASLKESLIPEEGGYRVTFVDFNGNVVGESEVDYHTMENHINRKEIQEALKGKIGEDIRASSTLRMDFVYIALPVPDQDIIIRISVPLVKLRSLNRIIWIYTLGGIGAGLVLTMLLALRFSSSITRPVKSLMQASREIAGGNYSKRVVESSRDELGQLAATFNEMASKLEKNVAELLDRNLKVDSIINSMIDAIIAVDARYRIMLINPIACRLFGIENGQQAIGTNFLELVRNNQINQLLRDTINTNAPKVSEVMISNPEEKNFRVYVSPIRFEDSTTGNLGGIIYLHDITNIKKLEQIRTEFVSNVTHELKTPLTSIRGFIETLRSGALEDPEVADKFLEIIDIEAERLYMLIHDTLQLSEIESRQKDTRIASYDLKSVIDEVFSILQGVADKKGISLLNETAENVNILVNRDRLKQMLINLIDNGIKYNSSASGYVKVRAYRGEGKVVITVADNGIGIPEEHIPRIFERFYRVDKGRSRSMGGTGLGLSIVKHIVNLYSGDIHIKSEPGRGTEFIISLPV